MPRSDLSILVGRNIRQARLDAGLTQQQLAYKINSSSGMRISNWELGYNRPSDENLQLLCDVFDRDPGWFFTDQTPEIEAAA